MTEKTKTTVNHITHHHRDHGRNKPTTAEINSPFLGMDAAAFPPLFMQSAKLMTSHDSINNPLLVTNWIKSKCSSIYYS